MLAARAGLAGAAYDITGAPKIVVVSGTDRDGSNTLKVAKIVSHALEELGDDVEIIDLSQLPKNTFTGGYGNPPKSFQRFQNPLSQADAVVILTPEYNGSMPGALKYFIDLLKYDTFKEKPVSIVGLASGFQGATTAADDLRGVLQHLQANVQGTSTSLPKIDELLANPETSFDRLFDQMSKFKSFVEALHHVDSQETASLPIQGVLKRIIKSEQIHTVQMDSGVQISGRLKAAPSYGMAKSAPAYLQFEGPTQLSVHGKEIDAQGVHTHAQGFGSPIGKITTPQGAASLSDLTDAQLEQQGIRIDSAVTLSFESGVRVQGTVTGFTRSPEGKLVLISFKDCSVTAKGRTLFDPSWGAYDMAIGASVQNVVPGAADAKAYFKGILPGI